MNSREARTFVVSAFVVLLVGFVSAQSSPSPAASGTEQQIRDAARQLLEASQQHDNRAAARLIADEATWVARNGQVMTKAQFLEGTPAPPPRDIDLDAVKLLGSTALVTGVAHFQDGGDARFLQEWVNDGGQWKVMAHQGTMTGSAATPSSVGTAGSTRANAVRASSTWRAVAPTLRTRDERAVWTAETALQKAYLDGDTAEYAKLTANDYTRVTEDGQRLGKAEFLSEVKQNQGKRGGDLKSNDVQITVHGDVARVIMAIWGTNPGGTPLDLMRLTRFYKRSAGGWQQIGTAVTRIPAE